MVYLHLSMKKLFIGIFFSDNELIFYKNVNDLSEKIKKYTLDEQRRKKIAKNGKIKYLKYFNSTIVANYIIKKSFDKL